MAENKKLNIACNSSFKRFLSVKKLLAIISVVTVITLLISNATVAYIYTSTEAVENYFAIAEVKCDIVEEFSDNVKSNVAVKNTSETDEYIRVKLVINWMSEDTAKVFAHSPVLNTDYSISFGNSDLWKLGVDGYWYYLEPLGKGETTQVLINECKLLREAPNGFELSVEILASCIQAMPDDAVLEAWASGVQSVNSDNEHLVLKG